jgi:hypothetical protein
MSNFDPVRPSRITLAQVQRLSRVIIRYCNDQLQRKELHAIIDSNPATPTFYSLERAITVIQERTTQCAADPEASYASPDTLIE